MSNTESEPRKPGRPKSQAAAPTAMKKGKPSWKPASVTDVINKVAGYRYRWSRKDADNLAKKAAEGWETVNGLTSDTAQSTDDGKIDSGKNMTSIYEKRDLILQRLPEELGQARDEYMNEKTKRRTLGLTSHFKKEAKESGNAPVHGQITISSLRGQQNIE